MAKPTEKEQLRARLEADLVKIDLLTDDEVAAIRKLTPAERVQVALDCGRLFEERVAGQLRTIHPEWDAAQVQAEIAKRRLCEDDMIEWAERIGLKNIRQEIRPRYGKP
jgi:hypothetical protein